MFRKAAAAGLVAAMMTTGVAQAGDHTGAVLGGLAVGVAGGAILGAALSQPRPAPPPAYVVARPQPPVYAVAPPPPRTVYVDRPVAGPYDDRMMALHAACDDGDRHACIRFGVLIGQHKERVAEWRRMHPDYFAY